MQKQYSAGAVKLSFWLAEFRCAAELLHAGKCPADIRTLAEQENLFSTSTPRRGLQIYHTVLARALSLPAQVLLLFHTSDLSGQRLINLIGIMQTDALFFLFMHEVFKEKLRINDMMLRDSDLRAFFSDKQRESAKVAAWTEETVTRLQKTYKIYLLEAGVLSKGVGDREIIRPLLSPELTQLLGTLRMEPVLQALTGGG